jgi:putative flippase GtrA
MCLNIKDVKGKLIKFIHGEIFSYLFFGACTTIVNIVTFQLFYSAMGVPTLISNAIAWVFSVAFAYVTNRVFVFHSQVTSAVGILREVTAFVGARLFSLVFDELIMWLMVDVMGYTAVERLTAHIIGLELQDAKSLIAKICSNAVVMILNFIFSKLFIFKKKK